MKDVFTLSVKSKPVQSYVLILFKIQITIALLYLVQQYIDFRNHLHVCYFIYAE